MTRAVLYARCSTLDGDQNPETQLMPLRDFVRAQGWTVAGEFIDRASAVDLKGRKQWRALLALASRRKIDIVVAWKLDRCFRSVLDAANTLEQLRHWGVALRSLTEPWADTTTAQGELIFNLLATFAQFERSLIAERVRSGMARAKAQGKHVGRPTVINGEWETVRPLLETGAITLSQAARQMGVSRSSIKRALDRVVPKTP